MIITPPVVAFQYKKYAVLPPGYVINYPDIVKNDKLIRLYVNGILVAHDGSDTMDFGWFSLYDINRTYAKVKLIDNANSYNAGSYSQKITFEVKYNFLANVYATIDTGEFYVSLLLSDTIILNVSPTVVPFAFEIGGATPVNQTVSVISENNWIAVKTAAWLLLPTTSGINSGTFQIGVDITSLPPAIYTDVITINDGVTQKTITVKLTVTASNTGTDYLFVLPNLLEFGYTENAAIPPQKYIKLNSSAAWTAVADQPWINLTTASGTSGETNIPIALQDINALAVGEYIASVTFTLGTIYKTVIVKLTVFQFLTELLTEGSLHFTDDDNLIELVSARLDTFIELTFSSLYKSKSYNFSAEIPFFNGFAKKRIGERPKVIIGKQTFLNYGAAALFEPYPVVNLNLEIAEKVLFEKTTVQTRNLNNLLFIKGEKPLSNWISDQMRKVYVTKTAVLYFSILTNRITASAINVTGAVTKSFNFTPIDAEFLTAVVPMASVGNLNVGDVIYIEVLQEFIEVEIKDTGMESSVVYWVNKWGCWDSLELTGEVEINNDYKRNTNTIRKSELISEEKIIDVTKLVDYKINTGWIHTNDEVETIAEMLKSDTVWLFTQNQVVKVNPTTKKLNPYKTDRYLREFILTFNNVIEK